MDDKEKTKSRQSEKFKFERKTKSYRTKKKTA